ncbi:uncharacterized protein LOC126847173 [Adelges cooleyi]|uniref:uncharacterized protein LOC126847173 n=1 Tax=Adelges cooleyi TaxID=133065 RepID=UPI0021807756|nr:uncharacterized protein LOC126847173 [Adelges cooleyi]
MKMRHKIVLWFVIIQSHLGTSVQTRSDPNSHEIKWVIERIWDYMEVKVEEEGPVKGQGKGFTTKATVLPIVPSSERANMLQWLKDNPESNTNVEEYKISRKRFSSLMAHLMDERELKRLRWRLVNSS